MSGGWVWTLEGTTEEPEESKDQTVVPSVPSVVPSDEIARMFDEEAKTVLPAERLCTECGEPIEAGKVRHGACFYNAMVRERIEKAS